MDPAMHFGLEFSQIVEFAEIEVFNRKGFVVSHGHTWFGAIATSCGLTYAGCRRCARRSQACWASASYKISKTS